MATKKEIDFASEEYKKKLFDKVLKNSDLKEFFKDKDLNEIFKTPLDLLNLESLLNQSIFCKNCKNLQECKNNNKGYFYLPNFLPNNGFSLSIKKCKKKHYFDSLIRCFSFLDNNFSVSKIQDLKFSQKTYQKYLTKVDEFIETYPKGKGLFINKKPNIQDYSFLVFITKKLLVVEKDIIWLNWKNFISFFQLYIFDQDNKYKIDEALRILKKVKILVIEEFGIEIFFSYAFDQCFFDFFIERDKNKTKTFILSYLSLDAILKRYTKNDKFLLPKSEKLAIIFKENFEFI
ncbi:hypothetical protein JTY60_01295 [symbiont of Argiope bruennichi]|uniref:hypothetical protein n=1 Tax=symbiont of Argiope bruennichi TaxID=2810479 RepID=UPI003DA22FB4